MKIIPLSRRDYQTFPLDETAIEITEAEYQGLQDGSKCFNESLTAVIDYVPTAEELAVKTEQAKAERIAELKNLLRSTDYQAIKYAEGVLSAEDYAETKAQRIKWREEINALEGSYGNANNTL